MIHRHQSLLPGLFGDLALDLPVEVVQLDPRIGEALAFCQVYRRYRVGRLYGQLPGQPHGLYAFLDFLHDSALFPDVRMLWPQLQLEGEQRLLLHQQLVLQVDGHWLLRVSRRRSRRLVRGFEDVRDRAFERDAALAVAIERLADCLQRQLRIVLRLQVGGRL